MQEKFKRETGIRRTVLVVDDELINRRLLGFIVGRDYRVLYAENGQQALDIIRANQQKLSLVLLDLLMPVMDGYELLRIMHDDAVLRKIPVIVLTSEKSAEVESLRLGAMDFIPKPYDMPEVILARVRRMIELAEDSGIISATEKDTLTGLYTKDYFMAYCGNYDTFGEEGMDAVVLNINRFHMFNELHGRTGGDRLLIMIAEVIRDVLGKTTGIACRCEPDMFYLYTAHPFDCDALLLRLSKAAEKEFGDGVSLRMGIYENVDTSVPMPQRFDRAKLASDPLRVRYDSAWAHYDLALYEKEIYRAKLLGEVETALREGQFVVYYQPKYNIRGDKPVLCSAEALVRWVHPLHGMISPGVFIPLLEENGLIQRLDRYVWREAAHQIRRWRERFGCTVPVSVNVSRVDLFDEQMEQRLLRIADEAGIVPEMLYLEVTESAYTDNAEHIINTIASLRSHGFKVEMDDFGSGYSSLNMLTTLPIDVIKLDREFICRICENEKDCRIVTLIADFAAFLSVPLVAEGVETREQLSLLRKAGTDIIQGFYFSRPVPPEAFEPFIRELSGECVTC